MNPVTPNNIISLIMQGANPQQLVMGMLEERMRGTPMGDNLIALAGKGDGMSIEQIARNIVRQKGGDFDTEFNKFKKQIGM